VVCLLLIFYYYTLSLLLVLHIVNNNNLQYVCIYRLLVLSSSALSIRGHVIGSLTSRISYDVPQADNGLMGLITVKVQPTLGSSIVITTNSVLQWDIHEESDGWMTLVSDAETNSSNETSQPKQPKQVWALSSACEYDKESFLLTLSEPFSDSIVDCAGHYSFDSLRNWYVASFIYIYLLSPRKLIFYMHLTLL